MEELIAQHNQRAGFDQEEKAARQPNHFEQAARPKQQNRFIQPATPTGRAQQPDFSPPVPKIQQQPEAPAVRKLNHDEALKQNALHRQQLAEVVAKHADRVDEVTKTLNIPDSVENEQTRSPEPSSGVPRGQKVDRFLAKEPIPSKSKPVEGAKNVKKSEATSEAKLIDEDYPDQLLNHLELLSKLDKQVEDLFSQALDVFSAEDLEERPAGRRKGGRRKGGRRSQGKQKGSAGKRPKKPRELSE